MARLSWDKETGSVPERVPSPDVLSWAFVDNKCLARFTGRRFRVAWGTNRRAAEPDGFLSTT